MHEFSIVQSIVNIALKSADLHHVEHISAVEVEVGQASGVVPEAMEFAWEAAIKGTLLCNAALKIKEIPLTLKCRICKHQYQPEEIYDACPQCGAVNPEILTGKELKVVAIET
jgi:hydrogenase nickel incorporation protein HypA/HybF